MGPVQALAGKSREDLSTILNRALDVDARRNASSNGSLAAGDVWQAYHPELPVHWRHSDGSLCEYYLPRETAIGGNVGTTNLGRKVKTTKRQLDGGDDPNSWCPNLTVEANDKFPKLHHWYVARALSAKQHVLMVTTSNTQRSKSRLHVPAGKIDGIRDTFIYRASVWTTASDVNEPGWRFIRNIGCPKLPVPNNLPLQSLLTYADEYDYLHSARDLRAKADSARNKPFRLWEVVKVRGDRSDQQFDGIIVGDLAITGLQRSGALQANPSAGDDAQGSVIILQLVKHQQGDGGPGRVRYVPLPILSGQSTQYSVDTALFRTAPCKYVHNKQTRISLDELQAQKEDTERGIAAAKGGPALITDIRYLIQELFNTPQPPRSSQPPSSGSGGARGQPQSGATMTTPKDKTTDEERRQWARAAWQEPVAEDHHQRTLEAQQEAAWLFPLAMKELAGEQLTTMRAPSALLELLQSIKALAHGATSALVSQLRWYVPATQHLGGGDWLSTDVTKDVVHVRCRGAFTYWLLIGVRPDGTLVASAKCGDSMSWRAACHFGSSRDPFEDDITMPVSTIWCLASKDTFLATDIPSDEIVSALMESKTSIWVGSVPL